MELTFDQLKDTIANIDADVYVVRREYATVDSFLRDMGYIVPLADIKRAVDALVSSDPYFKKLAKTIL